METKRIQRQLFHHNHNNKRRSVTPWKTIDERRRGTDETVVCTESDRGEMPRTESAVDGFGRTVVRFSESHEHH